MRNVGTTSLVSLFLILALSAAFLRGGFLTTLETGGNIEIDFFSFGGCSGEIRPCERILGHAVMVAVQQVVKLANVFSFIDPATSPGFIDHGWGIMKGKKIEHPGIIDYQNVIPLISGITFVVLCLCPILFLSFRSVQGDITRALFIVVALSPLLGWNPMVISSFFHFMMTFVDWPISYYHFQRYLAPWDFFSTCLLVIAIWLISTRKTDQRRVVIMATIAGQLTFEFLGFLFGVALFVITLIDPIEANLKRRFRNAISKLTLVGTVSVLSVSITIGISYLTGEYFVLSPSLENPGLSTAQRAVHWVNLQNTMLIYKHIISDFITITAVPVIGGAVFGGLASLPFIRGENFAAEKAFRDALAGFGLSVGYTLVFILGMLFAGYPAEMGRQFAGLGVILAITAFRATQFWIQRNRHQIAENP